MTPIKNIIFDFGGVICDLDFEKCARGLMNLGFPAEKLCKDFVTQGIFQRINIGSAEPSEFWEELRRICGRPDVADATWLEVWNYVLAGIPPQRYHALKQLSQAHHLFLLSNISDPHWQYTLNHLVQFGEENMLDWFDALFLSYKMHLEKPDRAIFKKVLDTTGVRLEETLFVDDREDNIAAARSVGLHSLQALGDEWIARLVDKTLYWEDF